MDVGCAFAANGALERAVPGFEFRPGQQAMAACVARCIEEGGVGLIEAGTGIGKTLAYLMPVLELAGARRVVISTATRALQDQIVQRELPRAQAASGRAMQWASVKGLSNYLCRRRLLAAAAQPSSNPVLGRILHWSETSSSGEVDALDNVAEGDAAWDLVSASSERRIGADCPHYERCFVTRMKRRANDAQLLVVNHALLFADLALRGEHPGRVLPDYDILICDEAHLLEEVATQHFGTSVSEARVERWLRDVAAEAGIVSGFAHSLSAAREATAALFDSLQRQSRGGFEGPVPFEATGLSGEPQSAWLRLDEALRTCHQGVQAHEATAPLSAATQTALLRRGQTLLDDLASVAEGARARVLWFESGHTRRLSAAPLQLGPLLADRLFSVAQSVVLTSATLANRRGPKPVAQASGSREPSAFEFVRRRLGIDGNYPVTEAVFASPFDFAARSLLYVPDDLPLPSERGFSSAMARRTAELVALTPGGCLVLTTSFRMLGAVFEQLAQALPERLVLRQGQAPKPLLLERFRELRSGVLVATSSFWQGVDVPGEALRLVVLEKTPFPVPTDPLLAARSRAIEEQGGSAFNELHLPLAQWSLKQGFGRLLRSAEDCGVVALLDGRVHKRGYGKRLLSGLPPAPVTRDLAEVGAFWQRLSEGDTEPAL